MTDGAPRRFLRDRGPDVRNEAPWAPFAHVARELRRMIADLVAGASLSPRPRILDLGCDDKPYRELFPPDADYVGADLAGNDSADVVIGDHGDVPLPDASFDLVLSTQVLEHVDDPARYLRECHRLLRPEGTLVLTTHGTMYLHRDPQDYWRWTSDGLAKIVTDAGLVVDHQAGILGLVPVGLQLVQAGVARRLPARLLKPVLLVFQVLISLTDRAYGPEARRDFGLVIGVRAHRPATDASGRT